MKSVNSRTKKFRASLENLPEMLQFICEHAHYAGFRDSSLLKIELAAEEAIVNIITHGYEQIPGDDFVTITCSASESRDFKITLVDAGKSFNPLEAIKRSKPKNVLANERTLEVGGYGIYFIVNMMDQVDYHRVNEANVLTLTKYFAPN
jgi:anti-sigma regulatory factor (Ser/Thr protein kinase)